MQRADDSAEIRREFRDAVNMPIRTLRRWLGARASKSVGMRADGERVTAPSGGKSVGHHMGERILAIRAKRAANLDAQDMRDMRKVVGYVHRHLRQRPKGDIRDTRWRKSLMNWGHDPVLD